MVHVPDWVLMHPCSSCVCFSSLSFFFPLLPPPSPPLSFFQSLQAPQFEHSDHADFRGYTNWFKILSLTIITVSLWCSVAIGVCLTEDLLPSYPPLQPLQFPPQNVLTRRSPLLLVPPPISSLYREGEGTVTPISTRFLQGCNHFHQVYVRLCDYNPVLVVQCLTL